MTLECETFSCATDVTWATCVLESQNYTADAWSQNTTILFYIYIFIYLFIYSRRW